MAQRKVVLDWKALVDSRNPPRKEIEYEFYRKNFYRYHNQKRGRYTS